MKIACFASGSGSNVEALFEAIEAGTLHASIELIVCDQPDAAVIERAKRRGCDVFVFRAKEYPDKPSFEQEIIARLEAKGVERIILAGYMRLIGEELLGRYAGRIVNIHPSLLPAFPGKDAIGQAFRGGVKITGVTIHIVDEGMDTGPIMAQEAVRITEEMTRETLQQAIQRVEHRLYPQVIEEWMKEEANV